MSRRCGWRRLEGRAISSLRAVLRPAGPHGAAGGKRPHRRPRLVNHFEMPAAVPFRESIRRSPPALAWHTFSEAAVAFSSSSDSLARLLFLSCLSVLGERAVRLLRCVYHDVGTRVSCTHTPAAAFSGRGGWLREAGLWTMARKAPYSGCCGKRSSRSRHRSRASFQVFVGCWIFLVA